MARVRRDPFKRRPGDSPPAAGAMNWVAPPSPAMAVLLWAQRRQIGCCLLLQAAFLGTGMALEGRLSPALPPCAPPLARSAE
ncbi:hypothetical protein IQ216_08745 [Cyanobium sp. LEGE 06143]|uniref:hypothetical protein n=1 Tax=Cyanobium sp. LEGE 06143 TaxID=945727 RepID=UPI001882F10F|nr:hypothetical protein [Cyanobium sp. LEGE 06143]MBE9173167.1 hypothetical protein [Cyanobium sp. LEGE 06143]